MPFTFSSTHRTSRSRARWWRIFVAGGALAASLVGGPASALDIVVANTGSNNASVLLNNGGSGYIPKTDFGAGVAPYSVAIADFSGNGKPDLAIANSGVATVSILFGDGGGSFSAKTDYATGGVPRSVAAADLNGDLVFDLAVANFADNTVSVLLGHGDGTFAAKVDYATGTHPTSVVVRDVNGDGKPDLVVAAFSDNAISVLLGNGDGTFGAHADYPAGPNPQAVAIVDLNLDGKPDVIAANNTAGSGSVSVLLGTGTGSFAAPVAYTTGANPGAIAVGDLNGDGKPDVAVAAFGPATASVLLGNGDGTLGAYTDFPTGNGPSAIAIGDSDRDGKADLAVADYSANAVSVLLGNGSGGFAPKTDYATGTNPLGIAIATLRPGTQNRYYVGPDGGSWNDPGNWSTSAGGAGGAGVPVKGDNCDLTGVVGNRSIVFDTDYFAPGVNAVNLYCPAGSTIELDQSAHAMVATVEGYGSEGTAIGHQTGGTNTTTGDFHLGNNGPGTGNYVLDAGSLHVGGVEDVYRGTLTQNGDNNSAHDVWIAFGSGSDGHYGMNGGTLSIVDYLIAGYQGTATFTQGGGAVTATHMQIGQGGTGNGTYTLQSGSLTVNGSESVGGSSGTGLFHQTGGTHTMAGTLYIATNGASGTYNLDAGTLNVSGDIVNNGSMTEAAGATLNLGGTVLGNGIIQTNGPATIADHTNVNHGTLQVAGGTAGGQNVTIGLDASDPDTHVTVPGNGTLNISGGTTTLSGTLGVGNDGTLTGGTGTGQINATNGTLNAQTILLGSSAGGSGSMNVSFHAQIVVGGGLTANDLIMNGGTLTVLDQDPPAGEDPVLNRSIVGGYLHDGAVVMNAGTVTTPNLKIGVTAGKVGTLTMNGGTLTVGSVAAPNGAGSVIAFNGGTLRSGQSNVNTGSAVAIGNGTSAAKLDLFPAGGTHAFAQGLSVAASAQLTGAGTIAGNVANGGTVSPGSAVGDFGTLAVNGSYSQGANGTLAVEIGAQPANDALAVTGPAMVAGTLNVSRVGGTTPPIGHPFTVLTGHPVTGTFATVTGAGVAVSYTDTSVVATFTGVDVPGPPPGTAAPLALALEPVQPNPLHSGGAIAFDLPRDATARVTIVDASGRAVRDLASMAFAAGRHVVTWDGRNESGGTIRPGVYWARLTALGRSLDRRFVVY